MSAIKNILCESFISENSIFALIKDEICSHINYKVNEIFARINPGSLNQPPTTVQFTVSNLQKDVAEIQSTEGIPLFNEGNCAGSCNWFAALYLNCKNKYPHLPPHKLLVEVAKEFENGVGIEAALLQKLRRETIIGEQYEESLKSINLECKEVGSFNISSEDDYEHIVKTVKGFEEGVYYISLPGYIHPKNVKEKEVVGHAVLFVVEGGNYYYFDVNLGLFGSSQNIETAAKKIIDDHILNAIKHYSLNSRTREIYQRGLDKLSRIVDAQTAHVLKNFAELALKGRSHLTLFEVFALIDELQRRGYSITDTQRKKISFALSLNPGTALCFMTQFAPVSIKKLALSNF